MRDALKYPGLLLVVGHGAVFRLVDSYFGGSGDRFSHLEGLAFDENLTLLGRVQTLEKAERNE